MQLNITTECTNGVTAACVYDTLLNRKQFIIDFFYLHWEAGVIGKISMGQFSDKLVDGFFGVLTQRNQGNNLRIEDMTRRLSNCAFLCVQSCVSIDNERGVSLSNSLPGADENIYSQNT